MSTPGRLVSSSQVSRCLEEPRGAAVFRKGNTKALVCVYCRGRFSHLLYDVFYPPVHLVSILRLFGVNRVMVVTRGAPRRSSISYRYYYNISMCILSGQVLSHLLYDMFYFRMATTRRIRQLPPQLPQLPLSLYFSTNMVMLHIAGTEERRRHRCPAAVSVSPTIDN